MSLERKTLVKCPNCEQEGEYVVWDSINVTYDPEMKEKIMNETLFDWTCPHCGKQYTIPYMFLYHDMSHEPQKLMIYYQPEIPLVLFGEMIRIHDCGLNRNVIYELESKYRENHPRENILFDTMLEDKTLVFSVMYMPEQYWEPTERKYTIPLDEYSKLLETDSFQNE